jgi:hypothetical protein
MMFRLNFRVIEVVERSQSRIINAMSLEESYSSIRGSEFFNLTQAITPIHAQLEALYNKE